MPSIQIKRANLASTIQSTALKDGEFAYAKDTGKLYIGTNGTTGGNVILNPDGGTADQASKLAVARAFSISGDGTAPAVEFDGTAAVNLVLTLANSGVTAGTYTKVIVDSKGRVTGSATLEVSDIPDIPYTKVTGLGDIVTHDASEFDEAGAADAVKAAVVNTLTAASNGGITVGGTATAKTVGIALDPAEGNAASLTEDGLMVTIPAQTNYTVTMTESTPEGYAKAYTLSQNGSQIGTINIPKDMVVESGTVETYTEEDKPEGVPSAGTYLVLTLANATSDKVYINVSDLIEYVTSGSQVGDMVVINIDAEHKVTATITDGTITLAKLASSVQSSLSKADSALQKASITTGTSNGAIAVSGTDVAVKGLGSAAYTDAGAYDTAGAASAVLGTSSDDKSANTVYGAKAYAVYAETLAEAAQEAADGKVATVTAGDGSVTVAGTATAPTVAVKISANEGNTLSLQSDGLFTAGKNYTAGNGINIDGETISAKVVTGNGLSATTNGITMAVATNSTAGAVRSDNTSILNASGVLSVGDIDCGVIS